MQAFPSFNVILEHLLDCEVSPSQAWGSRRSMGWPEEPASRQIKGIAKEHSTVSHKQSAH